MVFCDQFLSLSIKFSRFIHIGVWMSTAFLLLLNNIPLYGGTKFCLPIHQLMDIWVLSTFGQLWTMLFWKFVYRFVCGHVVLFPLAVYLGVELLGHIVTLCWTFWGTAKLFSKVAGIFYLPTSGAQGFSASLLTLVIVCPFDHSHSSGGDMVPHCGFAFND